MFNWHRKQKPESDDLLVRIRSRRAAVRKQALDKAVYRLDVTLPEDLLTQLLQDKNADIRDLALEYCQWHRPPQHTDYLVAALSDTTLRIRWKAVRHLSSFPTPEAAEPLRQLFKKDDDKVKDAIIRALGKCEDGQTAPFLFHLFTETPLSPRTIAAGMELGTLKATAYVEPLIQRLASSEGQKVEAAIWALGDIGDRRAVQPLLTLLAKNAEAGFLLRKIVDALGKINDPAIVEAVLPFINDERVYLQTAAMRALAQFQDARIIGTVMPYLTSENPDLRAGAVNALAQIGSQPVIDPILAAFEREHHPRIEVVFVRALAHLGDRRAIPLLEKRRATGDASLIREIDAALVTLQADSG